MREQHRRYWGERRHDYYRERAGLDWERSRHDGHDRGYKGNPRYERLESPDHQGGRLRDRDDDGRDGWGDGRRNGNDQWRGRYARGAVTVPLPNTSAPQI